MRPSLPRILLLPLLMATCGRNLECFPPLPGEATVCRADQETLWEACKPARADDGRFLHSSGSVDPSGRKYTPGDDVAGCYVRDIDTIFLEDSARGAKAERHDRAHRAGSKEPSKAGHDWN